MLVTDLPDEIQGDNHAIDILFKIKNVDLDTFVVNI
jgi:hypothetical protein